MKVNRILSKPGAPERSPSGSRTLQVRQWTVQIKRAAVVVVRLARGRRSTDTLRADLLVRITLLPETQPLTIQARLLVYRTAGARDVQVREVAHEPDGRWLEPWD